jgi:quercetin dioxygenase-like cupin family protein
VHRTTAGLSLALTLLAAAPAAHAHSNGVVPTKEQLPPDGHHQSGPASITQGVLAIRRLGAQPLDHDFPALAGRELRVREITIAPGGSIALHRHDQRPGLAYILDGEMTERRGPGFAPLVVRAGGVALESTGVTHWWRNEGKGPARALVVDIVPEGTP